MDYIKDIKESINTSITLKIFKTREESIIQHIYHSQLIIYPLIKCRYLYNFDNINLSDKTYDKKNIKNIVKNINLIKNSKRTSPIWIINHKNNDILLHGTDSIIASHIENKKTIDAYYIIVNIY